MRGLDRKAVISLQQHGGHALQGSEVVLLNVHESDDVAAALKKLGRCHNISLRHLQGNPLHKDDLKKVPCPALNMSCVHGSACYSVITGRATFQGPPDEADKSMQVVVLHRACKHATTR